MSTVKLQVPIDKSLKDRSLKRAKRLGFNSLQDLTRVLLAGFADGREVDFGEDEWGEPPIQVMKRWDKEIAEHKRMEKTGKVKSYTNVDELMKDLLSDEV